MASSTRRDGIARTKRKTFSRTTAVKITISARRDAVWKILVAAAAYPEWNSTVISLTGQIQRGRKIQLVSALDPTRTFTLTIKDLVPGERLAWGDFLGTRVFTLTTEPNGSTRFEMTETIGGPAFPLFASKIPTFDESFEQFAADLKTAAEHHHNESSHILGIL